MGQFLFYVHLDDMTNDLTVHKANNFVQASYSMTLDEMRILALTLGVFNPKNPSKRGFDFTVADFCKSFPDVNPDIAYTQVRNAVLKISKRWVTLVDNEHELTEVDLIHKRSYFKKEGRFYELCSQYRDTGWRQTSVEDIKSWLSISDKYPLFKDFKKRVLTPSINEINAKSDLLVDVEPIKRGRPIVALKFTIKSKKSAVKIEQKRPAFPHKNKYGKYVTLNRDDPRTSNHEYGVWAKDCLKILEDFYQKIEDVPNEDLLFYWIFLAGNASNKSKLGTKKTFVDELKKRGYKIVKCELVKL